MSIFGTILHKIFDAAGVALSGTAAPAAIQATTVSAPAADLTAGLAPDALTIPASSAPDPTPTAPAQPVDVEAVLSKLADSHGGGGNWRSSIVDLLKLLDMDSSLTARKQLAEELNVHVGADGTAEENIALHHAVMQKIADNGGTVPDSMKA